MSTMDDADRLRRSISGLLESGRYSDAKIECGGETFNVHKSIVCTQSEYFARAFDETNGFKEGQLSSIELKDIEASTVRAMIEFMYRGDYKTAAQENDLMLSINVYASAEMYQVDGLKEVAAQHFKEVVPSFFDLPTFPDAIHAIYQNTMEKDRGLRDALVETAACKIEELLQNPVFNNALDDVGAFGKDLVHKTRGSRLEDRVTIKCRKGRLDVWGECLIECGNIISIDIRDIMWDWHVKCNRCDKFHPLTSWKRVS